MARPRNPKESPQDVFIAVSTGFVNVDGQEILIRDGLTRVHRGSKLMKAYPGYFKPIDVHFPVETTAAAAESRGA